MNLVVDISVAESVMNGGVHCYNCLVSMCTNPSVRIIHSNAWRNQWNAIAGACCPPGVPITFKEYLTGWIVTMIRRSRDCYVGNYGDPSLVNQCIAQAPPNHQHAVVAALHSVELALHPVSDGVIVFRSTCQQGMPTDCQVFCSVAASFTAPGVAAIQWNNTSPALAQWLISVA